LVDVDAQRIPRGWDEFSNWDAPCEADSARFCLGQRVIKLKLPLGSESACGFNCTHGSNDFSIGFKPEAGMAIALHQKK